MTQLPDKLTWMTENLHRRILWKSLGFFVIVSLLDDLDIKGSLDFRFQKSSIRTLYPGIQMAERLEQLATVGVMKPHKHNKDQVCNSAMLKAIVGKTFRLLGYTVQYGCIAHCVFEYLGGIVVCSGPSMEPTIQNSDVVFSENLSCHFYNIHKGDIVIAKNPSDPKSNICKRVMGLEGDKVCTSSPSDFLKSHSYQHFTDNQLLCTANALTTADEEVPKGHVWLEGDNLRNSTDSRCYGPVPYGLIKGRICFKLWPLTDFGFLRSSPNSHRIYND